MSLEEARSLAMEVELESRRKLKGNTNQKEVDDLNFTIAKCKRVQNEINLILSIVYKLPIKNWL